MLADRPHGRRLTIAEQMQLDAIERALCDDDPQLAAAFRTGSAPRTAVRRIPVIAGAVLLVVLAVLLGGVAGGLTATTTVVAVVAALAGWTLLRRHRRI